MSRVSILAASLGSVLCMAALFVTVALAAAPGAQAHRTLRGDAQGVCLLHDLLP